MSEDDKTRDNVETAEVLHALMNADFKILQLNKQLKDLPHRTKILELRAQLRELEGKLEQVNAMKKENDRALRLLQDEEALATDRRAEAQTKIEESSNYKETTALTRELESYTQKIEAVAAKGLKNLEKSEKIDEVVAQVSAAFKKLKAQEGELVEEFKKRGGALKEAVARETVLRKTLIMCLPNTLAVRYEKASSTKGGVGAAYIENDLCSSCRLPFSEGQIMALKNKGPVTECPHCHRLLVTT